MKKIIAVLIVVVFFCSCSEYQNALKNEDVGVKLEVAMKMYEDGKYNKAIRLFEQLAPTYRGKPQAERLFYMYSQAYYKTKQYYLAGYQFESFVSGYPRSEKVQEAAFLSAYSYSKLAPVYSLDQADTVKALDKLQAFLDNYPNSEYAPQANETVKMLTAKLERKAYENAKGYNTISDFKSALVAFDNFIADFPGTPYKEDALFYKYDSAYQLAINSVPSKMEERLNAAKVSYNNLLKFKSDTKYKKLADEMNARVETDLQKFTK
jgi:outer membrane protein assembly factor BamD